jgi:hypothetical protein
VGRRPHRQGQEDGDRDVRDVGVKFLGNIFQHEHQKKKVEGVERPAEETRGDDVLLFARPAGQCCNCHLTFLE